MAAPATGILNGNDGEMWVEINGKRFTIPFNYFYFDNWMSFTREAGSDGVYYTQRGFRRDLNSGALTRVISRIRIADAKGTILPALEYHEDLTPAVDGDSAFVTEHEF